jgi:hypothetical protein
MNDPQNTQPSLSVSKRALKRFIDAVAEIDELREVSVRLRKTVMENDSLSETDLREALFDEAAP